MAGINFAISATDTNFKEKLAQIKQGISDASKIIERLGKDFDLNSVEDKVAALNKVIGDNEASIVKLTSQINIWQKQANEAFQNNDISTFNVITKDIEEQADAIQSLIKETDEYRAALAAIESTSVAPVSVSAQEPATMFFDTQESYEKAEALRVKIQELQAQISGFDGSAEDLRSLNDALYATKEELRESETAAAQAASELGTDLGNRAAEASAQLYQLNAAIQQQSAVVETLSKSVSDAERDLKSLQSATDTDAQSIELAQAKYDGLSTSLQNAKNTLLSLKAEQKDASAEWSNVSSEIQQTDSSLVKLLGGQEKYNEIMSKMPPTLRSAASGITGMTGAAKAFIATPLGAIIAAIVLALQALTTWFNSSAEGQMAFAKISGYVSGVLGQLKEIVISVGKAVYNLGKTIYNAFNGSTEAVENLWESIKNNFVNRVKALGGIATAVGKTIKAALSFEFDEAGNHLKETQNQILQLATGVEDVIGKTERWVKSTHDVAKANSELNVREEQLHRNRSKWQVQESAMETKIQELRNKAQQGDANASKQAQKLIEDKYAKQIAFQKEELAIIKERNSLTTNAQEDYDAEYAAEAALNRLEAQKESELRFFLRKDNTFQNQAQTLGQQQEEAIRTIEGLMTDLTVETEKKRIELLNDGLEKRLAVIENNKLKELQKITEIEDKFRKNNVKVGIATESDGLTAEQRAAIENATAAINEIAQKQTDEANNAERTAMNQYLKEYGEYWEKRQAIIELAKEKEAKAATEGEKMAIAAQLTRDLSTLDIEATKTTSAISKLFGDMSKKSIAELRKIASEGKAALDFLVSGKWDESKGLQFGITKETFEIWKKSPEELEKIKKGIGDVKKAADAAEPAIIRVKNSLNELFASNGDKTNLKKSLSDLSSGLNEILGSVSFVSNSLSSLGDSLGIGAFSAVADGLNEAMNVANSAMQGAQAGAMFGPIGAAAGAALGAVTSLAGAISRIHDKKHEKRIQQLQNQIDTLQKSYVNLGDAVEKAYSKDASNLINQQNDLLEQQKVLIQQQIQEEEAKKKTDANRIKQLQDQLESIDKTIADNKRAAQDAIFGEDLKAAIENFSDAYADAWSNGTDRAQSAKDTVKKMMQQMVTESIKSAIQASGSMQRIRDKLEEFYKDNVLSDWEQDYVYKMAEDLQRELDRQFAWSENLLSNQSKYEQESSKGYTAQLSEDTGSEISGRLTAAVEALYLMTAISTEGNSVLSNILAQHVMTNIYLEDITNYQKKLAETVTTELPDIKRHFESI